MRPSRLLFLLTVALWMDAAVAWGRAPTTRSVRDEVSRWAQQESLAGLTLGVAVADLESGEILAEHQGSRVLNPASGTKLLTTAAALKLLGPEHRWTTRFERSGKTLVVTCGGDPKILPEELGPIVERLVPLLEKGGVDRLDAIRLDLSRYDKHQLPPAYAQKSTDAGYRPAVGCLGTSFGAVRIDVRPGRVDHPVVVKVTPRAGIEIVNEAVTRPGKDKKLTIVGEPTADGMIRVVVQGELGVEHAGDWVRRRLPDPNRLTAQLLRDALVKRGLADASVPLVFHREPIDGERVPLLRHQGDDLAKTIRDINTWSNNYMAEVLFKELGLLDDGPASWERAAPRITKSLASLGVSAREMRVVNGSGLYRGTLISARAMTQLLVAMDRDEQLGPVFRASLARPGRAGTLSGRLKGLGTRDRVWSKTGTLDEVVSLSGYIETSGGHGLAFAIFVNDATPKRTAALRRAMDRLVSALARL